jgi:WD40 repeat protein
VDVRSKESGSRALTFSPDGQQLGIVGSWNNASIWDVSSGTELHRQYFPELRLYGLAFTTLGPLAFSGTSFNYFDIFIVYVDRVDTAWFRPICMHNGSILSPSEELVAIGGEHCDVGIWRWKEDTQVASLELSHEGCGAGTGDACYSSPIAFNASESRLATSWTLASKFSYIALWDTESGQNLAIVDDAQTAVFSPDGTRLVISGVLGLLVLDAETGEEITSIEEQFFRLAYSPNGRLIAASDQGGPVRLLDADKLTDAGTLSSSTAERSPIVFSPNSQLLATISADTSQLQLWDVATQKIIFATDDPNLHALNIAFSPDGSVLAASFDDRTVRLWGVDAVQ